MTGAILGISLVAFVVIAASLLPVSFAQSSSTTLSLEPLPLRVHAGDALTFRGILETADGYVISNAKIYIKDDIDFDSDDVLGTAVTDENGEFYATWVTKTRSGGGAYDIYAVFEGSDQFYRDRSPTYSVRVSSYYPTEIVLDDIPPYAYTDETVTFTGRLTSNGDGVPNARVEIGEDDPLIPDQVLARGYTDSDGWFSIPWDVEYGLVETDFDVYADFDNDGTYGGARSYNQVISVLKRGGEITLDPVPASARVGERVEFTGTLSLDGVSPEGAIVYIKDEDALSRDELLATAYVGSDGRFSTYWFAYYSDLFDDVVEIYAVFEGNAHFYRLTTCGKSCGDTERLLISGTLSPPDPPDDLVGGSGYMELYYSMDLDAAPRVAIVPSPDAYDEVKSHIVPVQEGIQTWVLGLEDRHGGDWDVDFEVISQGEIRFGDKPDVIVNLVTPEQDAGCEIDYWGVAWLPYSTPVDPVQTYVCSSAQGQKRSNAAVAATAGHEFIHAVGLGHAFGIRGDLMCSAEDNMLTCPRGSKSDTPSALNLDAVVSIYGTDGFKNPNNRFPYETKFYAGDVGGSTDPSTPETGTTSFQTFEAPEFSIRYPSDWDVDDEVLDLGANPGSWDSASSLAWFYDADGGDASLEVTFYEEDSNAINNRDEAYLDILEDRLRQECLQASYEYEGFECSNHAIGSSDKAEDTGNGAYVVIETLTRTYDQGEPIDYLTFYSSFPVGRNAWAIYSVTPRDATFQHQSNIIGEMHTTFELTGAVPGIQNDPQGEELSGAVVVGSLLPLTGDLAKHGEENYEASVLAVGDFNRYLEENGAEWHLKMLSEDSETRPVIALEKLQALHAKGVKIVLGPETSSNLRNIKGYADSNQMLLVSCCSTSPSLAIEGDTTFRMSPDDSNQGTATAKLLMDAGIEVVVPVWRDDAWGTGLHEAATESFTGRGGTADDGLSYNPEAAEFSSEASLLADAVQGYVDEYGADKVAVLYIGFGEVVSFMQSASSYDILHEVQWFGSDANTKDPSIVEDRIGLQFATDISFTTVQVASGKNEKSARVDDSLLESLGRVPSTYASSSYDAVWLVGLSIEAAQSTEVADVAAVIPDVAASHSGALGSIALNAAGDLAQTNYDVWKIVDAEWTLLGIYYSATDTVELLAIPSQPPTPQPPTPPPTTDPSTSERNATSFQTFRTPEFSIRYPSDWDVDDEVLDLGANPGSWDSASSLVWFSG